MNPITKYLKDLFAKKRIIADDGLQGLIKADTLLNDVVNEGKIPGLAITVLRDGKTLLQKGYGFSDLKNKTPVDPKKSIFRIASVSKPLAATALAHMVNDGLIDLDSSFYKYVNYFPRKKWDFTIRQLASHTAGIRGYRGIEYGLNKSFSIKESIEIFKDDDLLFEPGTDYFYNSYDWVLISLAMQEVSGIPFEEYVQEKVLKPLGLMNTFSEWHADYIEAPSKPENALQQVQHDKSTRNREFKNIVSFYSKNRLGFRKAISVNNRYKLAGGGYVSTTVDLAKFGQAYLERKVLNEEILSSFLSSETIHGTKTYYGLGWQVSEDVWGRKFYGHIGNGVGGYSNFFVYPDLQMVFAILINCTNPNVQQELDEVVKALISEIENDKLP